MIWIKAYQKLEYPYTETLKCQHGTERGVLNREVSVSLSVALSDAFLPCAHCPESASGYKKLCSQQQNLL